MGNCITSKATLAEDDQKEAKAMEKTAAVGRPSKLQAGKRDEVRKEKRVRFRLREEDANEGGNLSETKSGVVRIRLVLTQKELDQILNGENRHSCADKLLKAIKMRSNQGISMSRSNDIEERDGTWRPALESIPEDH